MNFFKNYKTIAQNTAYLSVIEIIRLILPFIALPYIIMVIGSQNYGLIAFAQTIISYFIIFINFGLDISAVKDVSLNRDSKSELNEIVSSVLLIKTCLFFVALFMLLLGIFSIPFFREYRILYFFTFLTCLSEILFPVWFYQGIEKMKYITIIRFVSILFYTSTIFIFVKNADDYIWVALLQSLGNILAGLFSFYFLIKTEHIRLQIPSYQRVKRTFKESIPFFFSRSSVVLNSGMAKTISGLFFSMHIVAAFDLAQKIASISIVPMQMLNQAVYPHIAKTRDRVFANKFFYFNILLSLFVSVTIFFLAPFIVEFFSKDKMLESIDILRILCLFIFFGGITTYIGSPVLVSFGYPKPFNRSVVFSTIILLILYMVLYLSNQFEIANFAFTLGIAEFSILIYRLYYCYHYNIFSLPWKMNA